MSKIDWDNAINYHIKNIPYIWYPSIRWEDCRRIYLFNFDHAKINRYDIYTMFENFKNMINKMKCKQSKDILNYFNMLINTHPEKDGIYKNMSTIHNLLSTIGETIDSGMITLRIDGKIISDKLTPDDLKKYDIYTYNDLLEYHHIQFITNLNVFGGKLSIYSITGFEKNENMLIKKIDDRFAKLFKKYGEPSSLNIHSSHEDIKETLDIYGVVFFDYFSEEVYVYNLRIVAIEMYNVIFDSKLSQSFDVYEFKNLDNKIFTDELSRIKEKYANRFNYEGEYVVAALSSFWRPDYGFGNCNFRFFYLQFMKDDPKFKIDEGGSIEFNYNPIHRHNIRLVERVPEMWNILKSFYPDPKVMMSWDSQKIRFYDTGKGNRRFSGKSPGKPSMTIRHHDIYSYGGKPLDRLQAMLMMQHPKAISLGFVPFSNDKKIRVLIKKLVGEKGAFGSVEHPKLNKVLDKWWRTINNGFVIWQQETIHYEGIPGKSIIQGSPIKNYDENTPVSERLSYLSFRAVIGTHTPVDLTEKALYQLAFLSENGFLPEVYKNKKNNKGTSIDYNLVNAKGTQYLVPRTMKKMEKDILTNINRVYTNYENIKESIDKLPTIVKEMYGIYTFDSKPKGLF